MAFILPHAELSQNDYREDAHHFTILYFDFQKKHDHWAYGKVYLNFDLKHSNSEPIKSWKLVTESELLRKRFRWLFLLLNFIM